MRSASIAASICVSRLAADAMHQGSHGMHGASICNCYADCKRTKSLSFLCPGVAAHAAPTITNRSVFAVHSHVALAWFSTRYAQRAIAWHESTRLNRNLGNGCLDRLRFLQLLWSLFFSCHLVPPLWYPPTMTLLKSSSVLMPGLDRPGLLLLLGLLLCLNLNLRWSD